MGRVRKPGPFQLYGQTFAKCLQRNADWPRRVLLGFNTSHPVDIIVGKDIERFARWMERARQWCAAVEGGE